PFNPGYYIVLNGEVQGPYDLDFIEAMVLSGLVGSNAEVSRDGKTGWKSLQSLAQPEAKTPPRQAAPPPSPSTQQRQAPPVPAKGNKNWGCLITIVVIVGLCIIGNLSKQT